MPRSKNTHIPGADCPCCGKNLDKLIQPAILLALSSGPLYGIDIVYAVSGSPLCGGTMPDAAGLYRCLKRMEAAGLLSSRQQADRLGGRLKPLYAMTPQGAACRSRWTGVLRNYAAAVERLVLLLERAEAVGGGAEYAEPVSWENQEWRNM